jgi:hypothetical protein
MANPTPPKPKIKRPFIIKVEAFAPVTLEYRVVANSEEDAYKEYEKSGVRMQLYRQPLIDFRRVKKLKVSVKDLFTGIINWNKTF